MIWKYHKVLKYATFGEVGLILVEKLLKLDRCFDNVFALYLYYY